MNLLIDTNVLIDIRRSKGDEEVQKRYAEILYAHDIYIPGVVEAELLHGAVSEKNQQELHKSLDVYNKANLGERDWKMLGDQLYKYRINGLTLPLADTIIASISMKYNYPVWSEDGHFALMRKVFPNLKYYSTKDLISVSKSR